MLGGEIIDFEGDLRRDGIDKLKDFIVSVRQDGYKEGKHETLKDWAIADHEKRIWVKAGRAALLAEVIAELPKEKPDTQSMDDITVAEEVSYNEAISQVRALLESKKV